jgi:acetolactate synthase small subunit
VISRRTKQLGELGVKRVTFVIQAGNRADVLARIVLLFHRLNVEIEALYMVRRRGSETLGIQVTIEVNGESRRRMQANLYKVVDVSSVKIERSSKQILTETMDD